MAVDFLDRPLFFVLPIRGTSEDSVDVLLAIQPSFAWYAQIAIAVALCAWPLACSSFAALSDELRPFGIFLCWGQVILLAVSIQQTGRNRALDLGRARLGSTKPFGPARRRSADNWVPALLVVLVTSSVGALMVHRLSDAKPLPAASQALLIYGALILIAVLTVRLAAKFMGSLQLPMLSATFRGLPQKIRDMAETALMKNSVPSEGWRYLDDMPQVIRRLGLHELIFRRTGLASPLAATLALLIWRMAPVFFTLVCLILLPFVLQAAGVWMTELRLPLALCIFNWAALALSYYVSAGERDMTVEKLRLPRRMHMTLFRALNLRPETEIIKDIYPYFDAAGVKSAAFLFTVIVPLYLALIGVIP